MSCYKPLQAWPGCPPNRQLVFEARRSYRGAVPLLIPCGRCIGCRLAKAKDWATRMHHEAKMHSDNCFLTLTYADQFLPFDGSVSVRAVQLFMKRLRKSVGPVRYYACGEYGERLWRPHYHVILFGYMFPDLEAQVHTGAALGYRSASLESLWPFGHSLVGLFSHASAGYVARYCLKKIGGDRAEQHYVRPHPLTGQFFRVMPEFAVMSRRPGIGSSWYDNFSSDAFPSDFCVVDGQKRAIPRFYRNKLEGLESLRVLQKRKAAAFKRASDNTPARLSVREEVQERRAVLLKRRLESGQ